MVDFIDLVDEVPSVTAMDTVAPNYLKYKENIALFNEIKVILSFDLFKRTRDMQIRLSRVTPVAPVASETIPKSNALEIQLD